MNEPDTVVDDLNQAIIDPHETICPVKINTSSRGVLWWKRNPASIRTKVRKFFNG